MWKKLIFLFCTLYAPCAAARSVAAGGVNVSDVVVEKQADRLSVRLLLDVSSLKIKGARTLTFTPLLKDSAHSLELPSVDIMGGKQYIYYLRNQKSGGSTEVYRRNAGALQQIPYKTSVHYEPWMESALLYLSERERHCCEKPSSRETLLARLPLTTGKPEKPEEPVEMLEPADPPQPRVRSVKGRAFIAFPLNRWEILENYGNNAFELTKIYRTIERTLSSEDGRITAIYLTGFASPESSWAHNERLAKNRTESLKQHLCEKLSLSPALILTRHVAEDWDGLRTFVENSSLVNKNDILMLIDSQLHPDTKEAILKRDYPMQYKTLVRECFPLLRHTDYEIEYQVRN